MKLAVDAQFDMREDATPAGHDVVLQPLADDGCLRAVVLKPTVLGGSMACMELARWARIGEPARWARIDELPRRPHAANQRAGAHQLASALGA